MKCLIFVAVVALFMGNTRIHAQVLAYEFSMDTAVYETTINIGPIFSNPFIATGSNLQNQFATLPYFAFQKKGTSTVDIFTITGKVGSITIPTDAKIIFPSQCFIDADNAWEYIAIFVPPNENAKFRVVDDDGSILLSDAGAPYYGFDGSNTYVINNGYISNEFCSPYKAWRFRTNITSPVSPALSKSKASALQPMMTFGASGNYQISLQPAGSGKTTVQLFDFLGRVVFNKTIDNITKPIIYSIPEGELPKTPFVAKVKDDNGSTMKREIQVR